MADAAKLTTEGSRAEGAFKPKQPSRNQQLNKLYALPAPLRTFPLPIFVPHNPLSLFQILYTWFSQTVWPESSHLDPVYRAWFSPDTRSVHVTDAVSVRGLWEHGFYGKGNLSRSEPAWLDGERIRRGNKGKITSEEVTRKRRAERQQTKWERARKEREAIDQTLLLEAEAAIRRNSRMDVEFLGSSIIALVDRVVVKPKTIHRAPVGPLELLALPNSLLELRINSHDSTILCGDKDSGCGFMPKFCQYVCS